MLSSPTELEKIIERARYAYNLAKSTGKLKQGEDYEYETRKTAEEKQRILAQCGIFARYQSCTFEDIEQRGLAPALRSHYREIKAYADNLERHLAEGSGLILWGQVGTMKTTLAVAVLHEAIAKGQQGYFITMPSLLDTIFTLKEKNKDEWAAFETRLRETPLLILDDFGGEYSTPWVLNKVDAIISERYNRCRPVIITTNLSGDGMRAAYAERIIDRLRSTCQTLTFNGPSLRLAKRGQS